MQRANCKFVEVTENNLYNNNVTCQEAAYLDAGILSRPTCFLFHAKNNHVQILDWINKAIK